MAPYPSPRRADPPEENPYKTSPPFGADRSKAHSFVLQRHFDHNCGRQLRRQQGTLESQDNDWQHRRAVRVWSREYKMRKKLDTKFPAVSANRSPALTMAVVGESSLTVLSGCLRLASRRLCKQMRTSGRLLWPRLS